MSVNRGGELLRVTDLKTYFKTEAGILRAVDGISFGLDRGESLGFVGESGCGKTTAALSVIRLLPDNGYIAGGRIMFDGRDITDLNDEDLYGFRWAEASIVFQGAMNALNPVRRVSDQISEVLFLHDRSMTKKKAERRVAELFEMVELSGAHLRRYPHEFSGGMRQRAVIAMALALEPKLVIGDEPTTALDVMVQAQILDLINKLRKKLNMSMIMITHDLSVVAEACDKTAVMYAGRIVEMCGTRELAKNSLHPYTRKLIAAFPDIYGERKLTGSIPGNPPGLINPPRGCRFAPRCDECMDGLCSEVAPELTKITGDGHYAACHLFKGERL